MSLDAKPVVESHVSEASCGGIIAGSGDGRGRRWEGSSSVRGTVQMYIDMARVRATGVWPRWIYIWMLSLALLSLV